MSYMQSGRRGFMIAALVTLLCLVCLTGSTLALFTADADDGKIGIVATAGDIKIDVVDANDENLSFVGDVLKFQTASGTGDVLFEPGASFYTVGFRVKNTGDIPVSFSLSVSRDEDTAGEAFDAAFEVWLVTDVKSPENAVQLTEFVGYLDVGESSEEVYYLIVRMKETAGNEYQNKAYTGIGITVYAVQGNLSDGEF